MDELDAATWWSRAQRYEEEQVRLRRELKEMEEEHRTLSALLQTTDGRTCAFKYLKRRHREIGERIWAMRHVDLNTQPEFLQ